MGLAEALETPVAENTSGFVRELAEEVSERAGSMVRRFARPGGNTPVEETQAVTGEQLGREFAASYAAALQSFKDNSPDATQSELGHAARELAGLAADVTRRGWALRPGRK